ncbi:MAG: hypothetical protein M3299_00405, partial [Thermoproteota archaeon]|nr:hypothetical protein [Thermoproteota archaeon]
MITEYTEVARVRLEVIVVLVIPVFLVHSSILTSASATTDNTAAIPEIVSDVSSIQIAPVLLAPMAISGNNVYIVWPSNQTGHLEILFRASSDNGQTFIDKVN